MFRYGTKRKTLQHQIEIRVLALFGKKVRRVYIQPTSQVPCHRKRSRMCANSRLRKHAVYKNCNNKDNSDNSDNNHVEAVE